MAAYIYVVTANGADIGVRNPRAAPPDSLHPISHAHVTIHHAPLIAAVMIIMAAILRAVVVVIVVMGLKSLAEVEARKLGQGRRERRFLCDGIHGRRGRELLGLGMVLVPHLSEVLESEVH